MKHQEAVLTLTPYLLSFDRGARSGHDRESSYSYIKFPDLRTMARELVRKAAFLFRGELFSVHCTSWCKTPVPCQFECTPHIEMLISHIDRLSLSEHSISIHTFSGSHACLPLEDPALAEAAGQIKNYIADFESRKRKDYGYILREISGQLQELELDCARLCNGPSSAADAQMLLDLVRGLKNEENAGKKELAELEERLEALLTRKSNETLPDALQPEGLTCFMCGECCRCYRLEVTPLDIARMASHLTITREEFRKRYLHPSLFSWNEGNGIMGKQNRVPPEISYNYSDCLFLRKKGEDCSYCSIYEARPDSCRDFAPSDWICRKIHMRKKEQVDDTGGKAD